MKTRNRLTLLALAGSLAFSNANASIINWKTDDVKNNKQVVEYNGHVYEALRVKDEKGVAWNIEDGNEVIGDNSDEDELYEHIGLNATFNFFIQGNPELKHELLRLSKGLREDRNYIYNHNLSKFVLDQSSSFLGMVTGVKVVDELVDFNLENLIGDIGEIATEVKDEILQDPEKLLHQDRVAELILKKFDMEGVAYAEKAAEDFEKAANLINGNDLRNCDDAIEFYRYYREGHLNLARARVIKASLKEEENLGLIGKRIYDHFGKGRKNLTEEVVEEVRQRDYDLETVVEETSRLLEGFERQFVLREGSDAYRFVTEIRQVKTLFGRVSKTISDDLREIDRISAEYGRLKFLNSVDLTGDGKNELIAVYDGVDQSGFFYVYVMKEENGNLRYEKIKGDNGKAVGIDIRDVDNDGIRDVVIEREVLVLTKNGESMADNEYEWRKGKDFVVYFDDKNYGSNR